MTGLLTTIRRAFSRTKAPAIPDLSRLSIAEPVGRVVVSGLGPRGVGAWKANPEFFYPPFVFELYLHGIELVFATTMHELTRACDTGLDLAVIHVYNEDFEDFSEVAAFDRQFPDALIFNRAEVGGIIGWKDRTHRHLTARGIPMPRLPEELDPGDALFSNERHNSYAPVSIVSDRAALDPERYNVEFIDTRWTFRGREYHTSVRMLCVGREIIHSLIRATDTSEGVRARGIRTPFDPEFLRALHDHLVVRRRAELVDLAARLSDVLGPGFYGHDLLFERGSDRILVCESGFKFDDFEHREFWAPLAAHMPESEMIFSPAQAARSATAFLAECRRHGRFAAMPERVAEPAE